MYVSLDLSLVLASSQYSSQPWLLTNIIDTTTNQVPEHLKTFEEFERGGVRAGVIGLVEVRSTALRLDPLYTDPKFPENGL